jgi:hypothetical protein
MAKFKVPVEKTTRVNGVIEVEAKDAQDAVKKVRAGMNDGSIKPSDALWDDTPQSDDCFDDESFKTYGGAEEV